MPFSFSSLFSRKPKIPRLSFEEWVATTTQADIEGLFLQVLKDGDVEDGLGGSLSGEELAHFDHIVSSTTGDSAPSPSTLISPEIVISHLVVCHPQLAKTINSSSTILTRLLQAHAAFPFPTNSSEDLTPPALLQAVILLTHNCDHFFGAAGWEGGEVTIRGRTPKKRMAFMFSCLATSPITPSIDDILDVLCRVSYPRDRDRKTGDLRREYAKDLTPVAERLLEHDTGKRHQDLMEACHISFTIYDQLAHLVSAVHGASVVEEPVRGQTEMDIHAFDKWAVKVDLLGALDKLFTCFLRERRSCCCVLTNTESNCDAPKSDELQEQQPSR